MGVPRRTLPRLTVQRFMETFAAEVRRTEKRELNRKEVEDLVVEARHIEAIYPLDGGHKHLKKLLKRFDVLLGGYGVRGCWRQDRREDGEWDVNVGDSYASTVLFCGIRGTFHICSFGDWVEIRAERKGRRWSEELTTFEV